MKKKKIAIYSSVVVAALVFAGCSSSSNSTGEEKVKNRWYTKTQLAKGKQVFQNNCAVCHGANAQSTPNWRKKLSDGTYAPPPLNGTAHAWHHPMKALVYTIKNGGKPFGGKMPGFEKVLSKEEIKDAIAYFQNFWNDEIYQNWAQRSKLN